ncbi:MAG: energy-coupled thiamine transporter ThiT [Acholeplasmataceae bacterium]|jgi:thiamine transporter
MLKNKSSKIILTILIIILLSFIVISAALIIKPSRGGIVVGRLNLYDEIDRDLIRDATNLKVLTNLAANALWVGIALFFNYVALAVIKLFLVNDETKEKYRKLLLMLLLVGIGSSTILIAYYFYILIRFPKDFDKYNNYAYSLGVANIIYLISLISFSTLGVWKVFTNQEQDNKNIFSVKVMTEGAMMVAVAVILSVASDLIGLRFPNGGSISLSMIPLFIFAFRHGPAHGSLNGFLYSIINLLIDGFIHWGSIFFDYLIPFTLVGFISGLFIKKAQAGQVGYTMLAIFLAGIARWLCHSVSGLLFFRDYFPVGSNAFIYTFFTYNGTYMIINIALSATIIYILHSKLITLDSRVV